MNLEVTADHIAELSDADLRALVGHLCEREAVEHGHSASAVTWGGHQNAGDGGIDVRVALPEDAQISGYVPRPATGFQVKAQNMPRSAILEEMSSGGVLLESIAELAAHGGAYIIVSSKGSVSDRALKDRKAAIADAVGNLSSAASFTVDFYDRRRLATWVNQHPGFVPWVRERVGQPLKGWRPFDDWSSSPASTDEPYLLDDSVRLVSSSVENPDGLSTVQGVATLRSVLAKPQGIVRLVGLSGVGKTRLIQALFDERIGEEPLLPSDALYADISDEPDPVPLEMLSHLINMKHRVVMIIDNCGVELHRKLAARIKNSGGALSVITVEYDINDDEPENTDVFKLEPASEGLIEKMLESRYPAISLPSRRVIAEFSAGNARVAFALANTAKNGESLVNLHDGELFKRLFEQTKGFSEQLFDAAKVCALLYSFDGETLDGQESELVPLAQLGGLTVDQLHKHVAELRRRQLVQKRGKWRAILPHALAHRLAKRALADIPFMRIEQTIIRGPSVRMLRSFSRRMGYLHDDERAVALAASWLSKDGLLAPLGKLNDLDEEILENIAPVDPAATLAFFEETASKNDWFFGKENENRKQIVRITRSIAYDPALFDRCVSMLKRFVLNETQGEHDSAADPLKSLFTIYLSGTHAAVAQRAAFVTALLASNVPTEAELGETLLGAMIETSHFTSSYSFEFGAWKRDFGWHPREDADIKDWYARVIDVVRAVGASDHSIAAAVRRLFASHIRELLRTGTFDDIEATVDLFNGPEGWPEGWVGVRRATRWANGKAPESLLKRLEVLEQRVRPRDLAGMVRSYAFSKEWTALDIANLEGDDEHGSIEARQRVHELCVDLGRQLGTNRDQFVALLPEILVADSQKTFALGQGLAETVPSLSESWTLLKHALLRIPYERQKPQSLAGFLLGAMARSSAETNAFLDEVLADSRCHPYLVYWHACAGLDEAAFRRFMEALKLDTVPVSSFLHLSGGRTHEAFSDDQLGVLLREIAAKDGGTDVAGQILGMRIYGRRSEKLPVTESVKAMGREFLSNIRLDENASQLDYLLGEIIEFSFDRPEHEQQARQLCVHILEKIKAHKVYAWNMGDTLKALAKTSPVAVLDILVEQAADEDMERMIFRDVRHHRACALDAIPLPALMAWATQEPQSRYVKLAEVVRFSAGDDDDRSDGWSAAARQLIDDAIEPAKVLDVFLDRFSPMGWSGSRADIMASRLPMIEALYEHHRPEVVEWARASAPTFGSLIERERSYETKKDKRRDERFE